MQSNCCICAPLPNWLTAKAQKALDDDVKLLFYLNNSLRQLAIFNFASRANCHSGEHWFATDLGRVWRNVNGRTNNSPRSKQNWRKWTFWRTTDPSCAANGHLQLRRLKISGALRISSEGDADGPDGLITNKPVVVTFMPSAYFYQNELAFAQVHQQWILPLVDTNSRIISPAAFKHCVVQ